MSKQVSNVSWSGFDQRRRTVHAARWSTFNQLWCAMRPDSSIHWEAYPALVLSGTFALGIVLEMGTGGTHIPFWGGGAIFATGLFAGMEWSDRRRLVTLAPLGRVLSVVALAVCFGGLRYAVYEAPSPRGLKPVAVSVSDDSVVLTGRVDDAPEESGSSTRFTTDVDSVVAAGDSFAVTGKVRVTVRPSPWVDSIGPFPAIDQGDHVQLRGDLRSAPTQRNPGGFDYAAYLSRRGICCTMYVGRPKNVSVIGQRRNVLTDFVVAGRQHIRQQIASYVPTEDGQAVLQALLLGDRSGISEGQRERFATTGLMHLFAVSGLHVFLVGMVFYMLLRPLLMRFHLRWRVVEVGRAVLTVVLLGFYMILTGARPSVVRAVIMSALFIGGIVFQRSTHPLNTLGVAALVLLSIRPSALVDVGFQLSMTAVGAIVTIHPRLIEWSPSSWRSSEVGDWLVSMVSVSAAATIGTAPILLYHFGWVSGVGLLLNVIGIPCTGLALSAAIAMVGVGSVWSFGGAAFGSTADLFVEGLLLTSRRGAEWFSWAGLQMAEPNLWLLAILAVSAVALAQWSRPRHRWRCVAAALLLATGHVWVGAIGPSAGPTLDLLFFDVGQGDAALITTPDKRRILVDTGPRYSTGSSAASTTILPFFERHGIEHVETVVITHPDEDHLGGLPSILGSVSVGQVVHSGQSVDTDLFKETRRAFDRHNIRHRAVQRGDTLSVDPAMHIEVLGPPQDPVENGIETENGRSVVLRLVFGRVDVLLPGDVETKAEYDLVRAYGAELASRVVKVPHHGSKTSSTERFVRASVDSTSGTRVVLSVGRRNQFGMPHRQVMSRWKKLDTDIYSTAEAGAVWLQSDGRDVWQKQWE